jgi:hypothetical protein
LIHENRLHDWTLRNPKPMGKAISGKPKLRT